MRGKGTRLSLTALSGLPELADAENKENNILTVKCLNSQLTIIVLLGSTPFDNELSQNCAQPRHRMFSLQDQKRNKLWSI